ncbi:DUF1266 domain-containing protein [Metabacillus fastidiosus]|uniref:DUF1266 domain-containing protein n=1 Tax=Metabacillus fastidiosus TaxID=1458 RepID=UPI002DBDD824|nr:DUF1266 domain-containing protein [Metabacillus fastidiosus]MEC2076857.1 DUF1266 domain-containing protein [Metabacillus fastidiosus]
MITLLTKKQKTQRKYFAALMSMYWTGWGSYFNVINQPSSRRAAKKILKRWDVNDSETMKAVLDMLLRNERMLKDKQRRDYLSTLSEKERNAYKESFSYNNEENYEAGLTNYYFRRLPPSYIAAVDYSQCVFLSKHGQKLGYLTPEEANEYMLKASRNIQKTYSCWEEYVAACAIGIQHLCVHEHEAQIYVRKNKSMIIKMVASKHSPFRKVSFDAEI